MCALQSAYPKRLINKSYHNALFISLMKRKKLVDLLDTLAKNAHSNNWSCIKWFDTFSPAFKFSHGLMVLSEVQRSSVRDLDDVVKLSSLYELQNVLHVCERRLKWFEMSTLNECCMRIGRQFSFQSSNVSTDNGDTE